MKKERLVKTISFCLIIIIAYFVLMRSSNSSFSETIINILYDKKVQVLNVVFLVAIFASLIAIFGSYWFASSLFLIVMGLIAIVNFEKVQLRNEGFLPSDLLMASSWNKILSMVSPWLIVGILVLITAIGTMCYIILRNVKFRIHWSIRVGIVVLTVFIGYGLGNSQQKDTVFYTVGHAMGNDPLYLNPIIAVQTNGPIINFMNNVNVKIMEKPDNYSQNTMNDLVKRYQNTSKKINVKRKRTKQKVVFILSESFSDPMQVPGVKLNRDPIPYTRNLIKNGVGGNMISDGYGGGTANMEYQALTGLSLGNFSATLPTPYTQLVVRQTKTFSINNAFSSSLAMHPYAGTLYSREQVFKKMRFNEFEYLSHRYPKRYTSKIGTNPYVSDRSAYKSLLYALKHNNNSQFVQLSTMQNHMPFTKKYYKNNQFKATGKFSSEERSAIETYSKGINYTDKANQYLLQQLKKMKENITVVFYGDHLPSIYDHVDLEKNGVQMHKTPYFIWSNHQKLNQPKYQKMVGTYSFASEMLQATDSKVTPYYALVQKVSERLPIIASKVSTTSSNPNLPSGGMNLINQNNEQLMTTSELTKQQKKLLHDYELVQYDFTAGHHYALNSLTK